MTKSQTGSSATLGQGLRNPVPTATDWGECLWAPSQERIRNSNLMRFMMWLKQERNLDFTGYEELWNWSVSDLEGFWSAIWDHFDVEAERRYDRVVSTRHMPGAVWFEGARLNFSQNALRHERLAPDSTAIFAFLEDAPMQEVTWSELGNSVRRLATALRNLGIQSGDRVICYLPNTVEAVISLLACAAIGAVFSSASPEFGAKTVIDRFGQLEPKLIFATPAYRFNGAVRDKRENLNTIIDAIPSLEHVVHVPGGETLVASTGSITSHSWESLLNTPLPTDRPFEFEQVAHDHPLWILFSSGTTGLPKAIVQSHVGILLEHLKAQHFSAELSPDSTIFFYTTTSWMVWNSLICTLLTGSSIAIYDGSPVYPDAAALWQMSEEAGVTALGFSPGLVQKMSAVGVVPATDFNMEKLEMVVLGGAPSTPETFSWFYDNVKDDLWVTSQTGGTDLCSTIAGGVSLAPVYAGEIQGASLGIHVDCLSQDGKSLRNETGELVIRSPSPSMPLGFWNDPDDVRYRDSYFSTYPGIWQQGDLCMINDRGGIYVFGRSDATLNRNGVRIGTAEIYRTLDEIPDVEDSLVVCLEDQIILFLQLAHGTTLSGNLCEKIRHTLRSENSPRHVPDRIMEVPVIPYTITGKRLEVPVRRLLEGAPLESVADPQMLRDASSLEWFRNFSTNAL